MARSLRERWEEDPWIQVGEQAAHLALIGAPPVALLLGMARWDFAGWQIVGGSAAALWIALVRELVDGWPVESWGDMLVDTGAVLAGGALCGLGFFLSA